MTSNCAAFCVYSPNLFDVHQLLKDYISLFKNVLVYEIYLAAPPCGSRRVAVNKQNKEKQIDNSVKMKVNHNCFLSLGGTPQPQHQTKKTGF